MPASSLSGVSEDMRLSFAALAVVLTATALAAAACAQGAGPPGPAATPAIPTVVGKVEATPPSPSAARPKLDLVEVEVEDMRIDAAAFEAAVLLKEKAGERTLAIGIGVLEAQAIALGIEKVDLPRPLTHDLLRSVIFALGGKLRSVVVNNFSEDGIFYGYLVVDLDGREIEIDARPSDAIALAVRTNAPIHVALWLLRSER